MGGAPSYGRCPRLAPLGAATTAPGAGEMVIDQLTARGVMEPSALYEAPFSSVHAGGPEALFAGNNNVISEGVA